MTATPDQQMKNTAQMAGTTNVVPAWTAKNLRGNRVMLHRPVYEMQPDPKDPNAMRRVRIDDSFAKFDGAKLHVRDDIRDATIFRNLAAAMKAVETDVVVRQREAPQQREVSLVALIAANAQRKAEEALAAAQAAAEQQAALVATDAAATPEVGA